MAALVETSLVVAKELIDATVLGPSVLVETPGLDENSVLYKSLVLVVALLVDKDPVLLDTSSLTDASSKVAD